MLCAVDRHQTLVEVSGTVYRVLQVQDEVLAQRPSDRGLDVLENDLQRRVFGEVESDRLVEGPSDPPALIVASEIIVGLFSGHCRAARAKDGIEEWSVGKAIVTTEPKARTR